MAGSQPVGRAPAPPHGNRRGSTGSRTSDHRPKTSNDDSARPSGPPGHGAPCRFAHGAPTQRTSRAAASPTPHPGPPSQTPSKAGLRRAGPPPLRPGSGLRRPGLRPRTSTTPGDRGFRRTELRRLWIAVELPRNQGGVPKRRDRRFTTASRGTPAATELATELWATACELCAHAQGRRQQAAELRERAERRLAEARRAPAPWTRVAPVCPVRS